MAPPLRDPDREREKPGVDEDPPGGRRREPGPLRVRRPAPARIPPRSGATRRCSPSTTAGGPGPRSTGWPPRPPAGATSSSPPNTSSPASPRAYRFTAAEHAAAELSLRDARKRYAIDSDRVFVAGQLAGGEMAWDFGLAHPDLFAGVVAISGIPRQIRLQVQGPGRQGPALRRPRRPRPGGPRGGLRPVRPADDPGRPGRHLCRLPQDGAWRNCPRRSPPSSTGWTAAGATRAPKSFDAATAREGDDRFFGVVVRDLAPGRFTAPEAADPLGKNLKPATIRMRSSVTGQPDQPHHLRHQQARRLGQPQADRLQAEVRGPPQREAHLQEPESLRSSNSPTMLKDLRIRGDRQQLYYFKVPMGTPGAGRDDRPEEPGPRALTRERHRACTDPARERALRSVAWGGPACPATVGEMPPARSASYRDSPSDDSSRMRP